MPDLEIDGIGTIEVDPEFDNLTPEQQNAFVANVIQQVKGESTQVAQSQQKESRLKTFGRNVVQGLGDIGFGTIQSAAEIGQKLPIGEQRRQSLANLSGAVSDVMAQREKEAAMNPANDSFTAAAGRFLPKLAVGLPGGILGSAAITAATTPQSEENAGLGNRAIDTAKMAVAGKVVQKGLQGVGRLGSAAAKLVTPRVNQQAVQDFAEAGIQPTLAQVSDNNLVKYSENALERFPGSAGIIQAAKENTLSKIQQKISDVAPASPLNAEGAGKLIQEGAAKDVGRFKKASEYVFGRLNRYVKADEGIPASVTSSTIKNIIEDLPREQAARGLAQDNSSFKLLQDLSDDISSNGGKLDYKTAKFYRSRIGSEINQKLLVGDTETGQLKQLYGSLSKDLEAVFRSKGNSAAQAFSKANEFYTQGVRNIEEKLSPLIRNQYPEKVFNAALGGTKEGGTRIRAIMKTLDPQSKVLLRSSVINKIGSDASGEFSPTTFIKNFKNLQGKADLFTEEQVTHLNKLSSVVDRIASVSNKANSSNTASQLVLTALGIGTFGGVGTAKAIGGAYLTAKAMTNPKVITWLAEAPNMKTPQLLAKHIDKLAIIASKNPDIQPDLEKYLQSITDSQN